MQLPTTLEQSLRKGYFWYECTHEDMGIKSKNAGKSNKKHLFFIYYFLKYLLKSLWARIAKAATKGCHSNSLSRRVAAQSRGCSV